MSLKVFYIGKKTSTISHFVELLNDDLEVFHSHFEILKNKHSYKGFSVLFFLIEKEKMETDLECIAALRKVFPYGYFILISEALDNLEGFVYLKNGILDTITPNVDKARLQEIFDFNLKHQQKIDTALLDETNPIRLFHLPLWKRIFDIILSLAALILLFPLYVIAALSIRIESKGAIVYKSKRVGSNYKVFNFYKFRSMFVDADKRLKEFSLLNQYRQEERNVEKIEMTDEPILTDEDDLLMVSDDFVLSEKDYIQIQRNKQKNAFVKFDKDPRITKVGRIIRKYSIDELPQLINVLKGDMSIVGNRPLPLYEAELLTKDEYIDRFMAPSGLTGLWQVEKRGEAGKLSAEERKLLDIRYAKEFSLFLDIKIIFKTFTAFIQKENV
ncbi:MAG: sugar transferase [Bacteroidales bacterium]|nr:sugar transferase [Bacteroidales bacterium]